MKKLLLIFNLFIVPAVLFLSSCTMSYPEIRIRKSTAIDEKGNIIDLRIYNRVNKNQKLYVITEKRYLAYSNKSGFENNTNRKAVFSIREGRLGEAFAYLSQISSSADMYPEIYNNMAVVKELNGDIHEAISLYSKACIASPGNGKFMHNFRLAGE